MRGSTATAVARDGGETGGREYGRYGVVKRFRVYGHACEAMKIEGTKEHRSEERAFS
jgi:hypothetical protein